MCVLCGLGSVQSSGTSLQWVVQSSLSTVSRAEFLLLPAPLLTSHHPASPAAGPAPATTTTKLDLNNNIGFQLLNINRKVQLGFVCLPMVNRQIK